jgi:Domain of unknown function (DUF4333)
MACHSFQTTTTKQEGSGMAKSVAWALLIPCALAGLLIGTAGCASGPKTVSKSDVESQISQKMTDPAGNKPESVSCPDDLKATAGAKLDCNMKIKDQTYGVNVTVTSIEGDTAKFDMVLTVDKKEVAQQISDQLEQQNGKKPDSVSCPDNLKGVQGATLRCTLVDAGQTYGVNVTVTSVEGSDVKFDIKVDDQPITSTSPTP